MAIIQRSKGYALRPTLSVAQIGELVAFLKSLKPDILCLVDNCYGEFVEETEPTEACVQACVMAAPNPPGGMGCTRSVSSDTDDGAALPGSKARGGVASLPGGKAMSNAASLPGSAGAAPPAFMPADLCVGSLIKNPGGGLAPTGGYIVGRKDCVERSAYRLTAPGLGKEVGASLGLNTAFLQGLFLAPTVVAAAHKGALFAAQVFGELGFRAIPPAGEERHDIIQAIELGTPEALCAFCEGIQAAAPVDSFVTPVPWDMPGYDAPVIMAAGAFVQGSSIELSADGPLKPPYTAYFQGGLTWYHAKYGILTALQRMMDKGLV
jgi:cystathionine beta-lyase family protein involved in aluminum resistance